MPSSPKPNFCIVWLRPLLVRSCSIISIIVSPTLFCAYLDVLSDLIKESWSIGCFIGTWFAAVLAHAEDLITIYTLASFKSCFERSFDGWRWHINSSQNSFLRNFPMPDVETENSLIKVYRSSHYGSELKNLTNNNIKACMKSYEGYDRLHTIWDN